jgi:peroxiredoxin
LPASVPTIADQVAALEADLAPQLPAEVLQAFAAEHADLDASGVPEGVAEVGTAMPDADLLDVEGGPTTLAAARAGRPAVVVFYRGAWCPYCNLTLHAYQDQLVSPLSERGVALIAISPQRPDGSLTMQQRHDLTYAVLSDPGNQIGGALGILTAPTDAVRAAQASLGLDVAAGNADGTDTLPMPTVVLVDASGVISWIDVHPNYATRTEPAQILEAVDRLGR